MHQERLGAVIKKGEKWKHVQGKDVHHTGGEGGVGAHVVDDIEEPADCQQESPTEDEVSEGGVVALGGRSGHQEKDSGLWEEANEHCLVRRGGTSLCWDLVGLNSPGS